jgi:glycosyltransferase involved in cell wall biosynthesis
MTESPPSTQSLTLAYLTSAYARAADSFIRGEVAQLRAMGHTVHTFSVNRSSPTEAVSDEIRREQASTEYLLSGNTAGLLLAGVRTLVRSPMKFFSAAALAWRTSAKGLKGRIWSLAYLIEAAYLAERLRAKRVQHLHNHIGQNSAAIAMLASHLSGVPYSLTIHGPDEFDQPMQLALGEKIARSAFTVAVCEFGRSQLMRWCAPEHWDKIRVVHCGVDASFLDQTPAPPVDIARFINIGRLTEAKGQLLLIQAAAKLAAAGEKFEIAFIGDGPLRSRLGQETDRLGLRDRVTFLGWRSAAEVRAEIVRSRALVLPSFAEGLPVVIMESLALGRPVIATYIAGIPELVRPGESGWLVPAGSVDDLAAAMRPAIHASADELAQMGRSGAAAVSREHNAAIETRKLELLIRAARPSV